MSKEIKIGLLSLLTIGIIFWGYNFIIGKNLFAKETTLYAKFNNVQDLAVSSSVIVSGLPVGVVTAIDLNPKNVKEIFVTLTVASKIKVPKDAIAILKTQSLMGGKMIELQFEKMCDGTNCAQDGDYLLAKEYGLINSIMSPDELDPFVEKIGPTMDTIFSKLGDENSELPINQIIHNLNGTMSNLNGISSQMNRVMQQSGSDLNKIADNLVTISTALTKSQDRINTILNNFEVMSDDFKKVSLSKTVEKTDQTIDQANATLKSVEASMVEANNTLGELTGIIKKMDNTDGTIGALLNDKELYDNLESTSKNLSLLLQDFRLNPKRYVNVSVFGKKSKQYTLPENDPAEEGK